MDRFLLTFLAGAIFLPAAPAAPEDPCRVIVNPANSAAQIQRAAVQAIYFGQMTRWSDGKPIAPVDQSVRSPVRVAFSEKVLGKAVRDVEHLWLRKVAAEHVFPPRVKASDAEVAAFVRANPGAIGYVTLEFAVDQTVKVLKVVDGPEPRR
jgi:ABC-type phosphate transport system substrate-binding protein